MFVSREWTDQFDPSVPLRLGPLECIRNVTSPEEAAAVLFDEWPETAGPDYVAAFRACLGASRGRVSVARARLALIEAARESGILAEFQPRLPPSNRAAISAE